MALMANIRDASGNVISGEQYLLNQKQKEAEALRAQLEAERASAVSESGLKSSLQQYLESIRSQTPDIAGYEAQVGQSVADQRAAAQAEYEAAKQLGLADLQSQYLADKERAASEQAAYGRYGSGVGRQSLGVVDAARSQGLSNLISSLAARKAGQQYQTAASAPQQLLAGRQYALGARQGQTGQYGDFSKTLANLLESRAGRAQGESQFQRQMNFNIGQLAQQGALQREGMAAQGRQSLEAQEGQPGFWGQLGGSVLSGIAGGLAGGIGTGIGNKIAGIKKTT